MNPHTTRRPTSSAGYPRALRDVKRVFGVVYENAHIPYLVLSANLVCLAVHIHRHGGVLDSCERGLSAHWLRCGRVHDQAT
jgi:hypothetical protein